MHRAKKLGWVGVFTFGIWLGYGVAPRAEEAVQTDWCDGDGVSGPVMSWERVFDADEEVSWCSVPGQVALASAPLSAPVHHALGTGLPVAFGVHPVDIDQDGDLDVIGGAGEAQQVLVWYNEGGSPPGWTQQTVDATFPGASGVHAADIDGDGDLDIVAAAEHPGNKLAWWRNDGGAPIAWSRQLLDNYFPVSCSITTADINEDGRPDVLATSWSLADVTWWRNDGGDPVTWTEQTIDGYFGGAHDAYAVDLDDDGDLDVVGAAGTHHRVAWWRNNGGDPIDWERFVIESSFTGARAVHVTDIDRDGRLDVVAVAFESHVSWWRNEGGNPITWARYDIDDAFNGAHCVWTGDVDGDGWIDVMATAYYDNSISWWRNSGTQPITWEEHPLTTTWLNPMNLRAGDLDGDGDLEVVGSSRQLGEFAYWELTSFKPAGTLRSSILDLGATPELASIDWTIQEPVGTLFGLRVRSSDDAGDLGPWSGTITSPGTLGIEMGRYFQYEVDLSTSDAAVSPIVREIQLTWEPSSAVHGERFGADGYGLKAVRSVNGAAIQLSIPESCHVNVSIYDVAGRQLVTVADHTLAAGEHQLAVRGLATGIYLCRMSAGDVVLSERMAVLH